MKLLSGKRALVTGASRGIGRAIARRFAAEGATVGVHYGSNEDAAQETLAAIRNAGGQAFPVKADLSLEGSVDVLFGKLESELDGKLLDILVNNAAIGGLMGGIAGTSRGEFDRVFAVNVRAPFFIIQRALPLMRDGGRIINISSADTRIAIPGEIAYSMTKGAINVLSRTLAHAVGARGITVNAIAPGITETGKLTFLHEHPEIEAMTRAAIALGRIGEPEAIADIVAFLASNDARWITGQVLDASGGLCLGPPDLLAEGRLKTDFARAAAPESATRFSH